MNELELLLQAYLSNLSSDLDVSITPTQLQLMKLLIAGKVFASYLARGIEILTLYLRFNSGNNSFSKVPQKHIRYNPIL